MVKINPMKKTIAFFLLLLFSLSAPAQIYTAKAGATSISFYSEAPLENIEAVNKGAIIVFKASTSEIQVRVSVQNFKFKNALMEEHFNENYLETDKKIDGGYPNRNAEFKGKINETVDYTKDGETKVTVTGKLTLHNVTRDVTLNGTLTKSGTEITINSKFRIKVADYNIKVPSMYVKNIAEEVDVAINSTLEPLQKK